MFFYILTFILNMTKKTVLIFFCVFGIGNIFCQINLPMVIATSGAYFKPSTFTPSLSWTIGECINETFNANNNTLTQGFQQNFEYIITIDINEIKEKDFFIKVFPNPSSDFITISISTPNKKQADYFIVIYDLQGKIVYTANYNKNEFLINMLPYTIGTYILGISNSEHKSIYKYKIVKTNKK